MYRLYSSLQQYRNNAFLRFTLHFFIAMLLFIQTADPCASAGRVSAFNLSDQTRMELLVENVPNNRFRTQEGDFLSVCFWEGIECDAEENVTAIDWGYVSWTKGAVSLEWLPPNLEYFGIARFKKGQSFTGTIDTEGLPKGLDVFDVSCHGFSGTINLCTLPAHLITLSVTANDLEGPICLDSLPSTLVELNLSSNAFVGDVSLDNLPPKLSNLDMSFNSLSGTIETSALPDSLGHLDLNRNKFHGTVNLETLPAKMQTLSLRGNSFFGSLSFASLPKNMREIDLNLNQFSGTVRFGNLPPSIRSVSLGGNKIEVDEAEKLPHQVHMYHWQIGR